MKELFHVFLEIWFGWVRDGGYPAIFFLMAMESSIFPVPSEVVMPPAAYWAAQGQLSFSGVILAGTLGSWFGSIVTYFVARIWGLAFIHKYGRYFLLTPEKIKLAETWAEKYGLPGVFFARLLPVVRHLISIPAGLVSLPVGRFSVVTIIGAGLWCSLLSWYGAAVLGDAPELLANPEAMIQVIKAKLIWFVLGVAVLGALLLGLKIWFARGERSAQF